MIDLAQFFFDDFKHLAYLCLFVLVLAFCASMVVAANVRARVKALAEIKKGKGEA